MSFMILLSILICNVIIIYYVVRIRITLTKPQRAMIHNHAMFLITYGIPFIRFKSKELIPHPTTSKYGHERLWCDEILLYYNAVEKGLRELTKKLKNTFIYC